MANLFNIKPNLVGDKTRNPHLQSEQKAYNSTVPSTHKTQSVGSNEIEWVINQAKNTRSMNSDSNQQTPSVAQTPIDFDENQNTPEESPLA